MELLWLTSGLKKCIQLQKDPTSNACDHCPYSDDQYGTCQSLAPLLQDALDTITYLRQYINNCLNETED